MYASKSASSFDQHFNNISIHFTYIDQHFNNISTHFTYKHRFKEGLCPRRNCGEDFGDSPTPSPEISETLEVLLYLR